MLLDLEKIVSIGGLVVKLAVAIRDIISDDSASPGFDSRPMHNYDRSLLPILGLFSFAWRNVNWCST